VKLQLINFIDNYRERDIKRFDGRRGLPTLSPALNPTLVQLCYYFVLSGVCCNDKKC